MFVICCQGVIVDGDITIDDAADHSVSYWLHYITINYLYKICQKLVSVDSKYTKGPH